jgi:hypothetical protein
LRTLRVLPSWFRFAYPKELGHQDQANDEEKAGDTEETLASLFAWVEANDGE